MKVEKELLGFTAGNFDLLHPGYIKCFKWAKKHCDKLIIFLQQDPSEHRKNKYKPVIPLWDRYEALMSIRYIDDVYIYQTEEDLYELIKFFKPDIRILGEDYIGKTDFTALNKIMNSFWIIIFVVLGIIIGILIYFSLRWNIKI